MESPSAIFRCYQVSNDLAQLLSSGEFWVFGYGSLMWRPGFPYDAKSEAHLHGFHRRLCVTSRHHRGTAEQPGLVMGLDRGGSCRGMAYLVPTDQAEQTLAYLDEREIAHYPVYRRAIVTLRLDGENVARRALTYVVDRHNEDYAGHLDVDIQAEIVAKAKGLSGLNRDYLHATLEHIHKLGLRDPRLEAVSAALPDTS